MKITNNLNNLGVFKDFSDGTLKTVFDAGENKIIEITLLKNKDNMDVVCVPTHHFCSLGCKMCHLTNKGLNKNMRAISYENFVEALIKGVSKQEETLTRRTNKDKLLISFMGVGEPLLNLKLIQEVYKNEESLKEILGYEEISYAMATMMPNDISKLTEMVTRLNIPLKLHFSLHTPIDELRYDLIPATKVSVEEALTNLIDFRNKVQSNEHIMKKYVKFHRTTDPVEIHYTLIENVNDNEETLEVLCQLLNKYKIPIKFISFNPTDNLSRSRKEDQWVDSIKGNVPDLRVKTYTPPGRQIGSSCGEFTKHYYHEEIETKEQLEEFEKWKKKHELLEQNRDDYLSWDEYFMAVAKLTSMRSKDPSTQVGACIVSEDNRILSIGYNGTPNGYHDDQFPWNRDGETLDTKYLYVCHGEMNAIVNFRGSRKELENAKLYTDLFPCNECAKIIIQAGIKEVVYLSDKYAELDSMIASRKLFDTCGVTYRQFEK